MNDATPPPGVVAAAPKATPRFPALAPFSVRAFRFQWPADLTTSWAFEMEAIILGWYILVETGSVALLAAFGSLQFVGTLLSPLFGVMGDRFGLRNVLCAMRGLYALLAAAMMAFAFTGTLDPVKVFVLAGLMGMVRPSDNAMRHALIGGSMPAGLLLGGMSIARTTMDSAKIAGAIAGAGLADVLGLGVSYAAIAGFYAVSCLLTLGVGAAATVGVTPGLSAAAGGGAGGLAPRKSPFRDIVDSVIYVWNNKPLLAAMTVAFLVNATAWPLMNGLLPYVAREIYHIDRVGLAWLVASMAAGSLVGSIVLSRGLGSVRPGRVMIVAGIGWHLLLLAFAYNTDRYVGMVLIAAVGYVQTYCSVPLIVILARFSDAAFRGRVMGLRMLVVYALPLTLLASGPLIERLGFALAMTPYFLIGMAGMAWIGWHWRAHIWHPDAPTNAT